MQIVHFLGHVFPTSLDLTIDETMTAICNEPQLNFSVVFSVRVQHSSVDVECQAESFPFVNYRHLYIRALDYARVAVDLFSLATGLCQVIVLEKFIGVDGNSKPTKFVWDQCAAECIAFSINSGVPSQSFSEIYNIVAADPELFMAIRDLIGGLDSHEAVINCGRALEGIRRMISPTETNYTKAWAAMQSTLNVSRHFQEWVTDLSKEPRHGNRSYISAAITGEAIRRTCAIINRFLEYRKRGNTPLPINDFPTLA